MVKPPGRTGSNQQKQANGNNTAGNGGAWGHCSGVRYTKQQRKGHKRQAVKRAVTRAADPGPTQGSERP